MRTVPRNFAYGTSMSWNAHDPNYMTAQASTFSMKIVPHRFNYRTQFPSYPPLLLNEPSSSARVTPKGNYTPLNNPPKPVPHVPSEPGSDPSLSDCYFLDSSNSSDSVYYKRI